MSNIVIEILRPVNKILTRLFVEHLGYVIYSTKHVTHMNEKWEFLGNSSVDVKNHMDVNSLYNQEIPTGVPDWLKEVEKLKEEVEKIPSDRNGCLNMKMRYHAGRKACKNTERIDELIQKNSFDWNDAPMPTGRVNSQPALSTTSAPSSSGDGFKSRLAPFNMALKCLQQDHNKSQVIALCGMGGVGKTTMMEQLKRVANDNNMFDLIVSVAIGASTNMYSIQNDIAIRIGGKGLLEATVPARADALCRMFKQILEAQKKKVLVILDDVWQNIELKEVGLTSPLPNGVTLLLTSRKSDICKQIAVDAGLVLEEVKVNVLTDAEAKDLFFGIAKDSKDDPDLYAIGCLIVEKCGCLPLAIKIIGRTLAFEKQRHVWSATLQRLNNNIDEIVQNVVNVSYENIKKEDDKEVFLLCGLFPEDSDIPIEDLTRYAWGLSLLKGVSTLGDARDRTQTCVQNLINANLLLMGSHFGTVKLHDLVLSFVLHRISEGEHSWIVNHSGLSQWGGDERSESCTIISSTCMGISKFPGEYKYPRLSLLQLMHGDSSFMFPEDFYKTMENLKVIAYYKMQYPLLPRSLQCSTSLKVLCLHECKLMFDFSFVGDLVNLEVLSFAHCGIRKLPSAIGNLINLKLLDLTGCAYLRIDDGVFTALGKLEELYMTIFEERKIRFTGSNWEELKTLSRQLSALEIEFVEKTQMKKLSFEKLVKFKIAMGCKLKEKNENDKYSFTNTLKLVTDRNDLLDCKIAELFKKTEVLSLEVEGLICLKDVLAKPYDECSFRNLRILVVRVCPDLEYLFPISVVSGLKQLECLKISSCSALEALVRNDESEINCVGEMITFEKLKFLYLEKLPKLERLFPDECVVQLPQLVELEVVGLCNFTSIYPDENNNSALLNGQVKIAKLEKLLIGEMEKLEKIWGSEIGSEEELNNSSMLRDIVVKKCDRLVNLFPTNPMRLLNHLESLKVINCGSLEVIFNIELDCVGHEVEQLSSLRSIVVEDSETLGEVWRIKGGENNHSSNSNSNNILIRWFAAVERIRIQWCNAFRNIFTPTRGNTKFDMSALVDISIVNGSNADQEAGRDDTTVAFPSNLTLHYLRTLYMHDYKGVEMVFEIECPTTSSKELVRDTYNQQSPLPNLQVLDLSNMKTMSHVWKYKNWNTCFQDQSSFHNLTTIKMKHCKRIRYLFSPLMAKHFSNLKEIEIRWCNGMEEVVSSRDDKDEEMSMSGITLFPQLHSLSFEHLPNLMCFGGGGAKGITYPIDDQFKVAYITNAKTRCYPNCFGSLQHSPLVRLRSPWKSNGPPQKYSREIYISSCNGLSTVIPINALGHMQKLQVLNVVCCDSLREVFETQSFNNGGDRSGGTIVIPRRGNVPLLSNLKKLVISSCNLLQLVFTFSTLESLKQLEELTIKNCNAMKVIVKKEDEEERKDVIFPRLKSLELRNLPNLEGFFLGINVVKWPSLEKVMIHNCPRITVFTSGHSEALALKFIHTSLGKHSLGCGLNFHLTTDQTSSESTSLRSTSLERLPWCFHNLIKLHMDRNYGEDVKNVIPSNELQNLRNLESINVHQCSNVEEVFEVEAMEGTTSDSQAVVEIVNLKEVQLNYLEGLKCIWKGNHHGTVLKFPNLTTLSIKSCSSLKHVFTSSMVGSLVQLKDLRVSGCKGMKVIVKVEKEESKPELIVKEEEAEELEVSKDVVAMKGKISNFAVVEIPNLRQVKLESLANVKYMWKSNNHRGTGLKFLNLTTLSIKCCDRLEHVFTSSMVGSLLNLQELHVDSCEKMEVIVNVEKQEPKVFEVVTILEGTKSKSISVVEIPNLRQVELRDIWNLKYIWKSNDNERTLLKFPNLTTLSIKRCRRLKHVFTSSMVGSLQQLQHLHIHDCLELEVIVNVEEDESECDAEVKDIVLPCLKSLKLKKLKTLEGFCLGKDYYSWPSLDTLEIKECPQITVFTNGHLDTPTLNIIDTNFGRCYLEEDLNSFIKIKKQEGFSF